MNVIGKIKFKIADELLKKRFSLFNKEIIISEKEVEKLETSVIMSLKLQGCYFTFEEVE